MRRGPASRASPVEDELPLQFGDEVIARGFISPKRPLVERSGSADLFPYYAGFSFDFAVAELKNSMSSCDGNAIVLDPWNGSGTTTRAAQYLGLTSLGVDLNPAANVAASLRCHQSVEFPDFCQPGIVRVANGQVDAHPLSHWFERATVARLLDWITYFGEFAPGDSPGIQAGTLALFRVVRSLTKSFQGSNPTWIRRAKTAGDKVGLGLPEIDKLIKDEYSWIVTRLKDEVVGRDVRSLIVTASANSLPISSKKVNAILTSPPYLTRIDYAVAYARELATLGVDVWGPGGLRKQLMGTTLTRQDQSGIEGAGPIARVLLADISNHESKASKSYYSNQAAQYIEDLGCGLDEITRVSEANASLTLVVQDSYYKDVQVPLAGICVEEACRRGWVVESVRPFRVKRSLVDLNSNARVYTKGNVSESVIRLRLEDSTGHE